MNFFPNLRPSPSSSYGRYWLATLARASYYPTAVPVLALLKAATDAAWTPLLQAAGSVTVPAWQVWRLGANIALLAVAGTTDLETWYHHVEGATGPLSPGLWPGAVNTFLASSTVAVVAAAAQAVGPLPSPCHWLLTGHSWGGAVAQLAPWVLRQTYALSAQVVTFASPRVGNAAYAAGVDLQAANTFYLSHEVNPSDPVPRLPPELLWGLPSGTLTGPLLPRGGYVRAGLTRTWEGGAGPTVAGSPVPRIVDSSGALNAVYGGLSLPVRCHQVYYYVKKCWQDAYARGGGGLQAQLDALQYGYSLKQLDQANATMNALDMLTSFPQWPASPAQEP